MAVKAFPKRKGRFQLELQRQSWAPPASDTSVLVATRDAVHDLSNTNDFTAPRTSSPRLTLRTWRPSSADPRPASYHFRPTLAPTYALIAHCRNFHSLARRAIFRAHSSIFRPFVTESRRALATRGRVGSAVWAAAVDEGYRTRGEVHKAGGGKVGGQSSMLFLSPLDRPPLLRLPTSPPPTYLLDYFVVAVC
ncbi:hypothetical protein K523DRAFT_4747 [Schizophyllum commune Tattone D]|nr:hypothetical protein K523DRAFT_4747 [Schizophyllum commune Tattone D]